MLIKPSSRGGYELKVKIIIEYANVWPDFFFASFAFSFGQKISQLLFGFKLHAQDKKQVLKLIFCGILKKERESFFCLFRQKFKFLGEEDDFFC